MNIHLRGAEGKGQRTIFETVCLYDLHGLVNDIRHVNL